MGANRSYHHPDLWLDDGDLVLIVDTCAFKVPRKVLFEESRRALAGWRISDTTLDYGSGEPEVVCIQVPETIQVRVEDVEVLLQYLYRDDQMSQDTTFPRVAAILRASSSQQFDLPRIHAQSLEVIEKMFPSGPQPFLHPEFLQEALEMSFRYQISSIQKGLYYSLVTTSNFEVEDTVEQTAGVGVQLSDATLKSTDVTVTSISHNPTHSRSLSSADAQRCTQLIHCLIDHFTPILFTPATTVHMSCTDVFADRWMDLVIQPAIENDGVYKPLETLQKTIEIDWEKEGLCKSCVQDKRAEWQGEQRLIWSKVDGWLDLSSTV